MEEVHNYLVFGFVVIVIVSILTQIIVLVFVKVLTLNFILQLLELKGLASIPVNSTGDKLLLDVFAKMVIKFESLFELLVVVLFIIVTVNRLGRVKEIEETLGRNGALNNTSLLGV